MLVTRILVDIQTISHHTFLSLKKSNNMSKFIFQSYINILLIFISINAFAQIPDGYYDGTEGLFGEDLQQALHSIIDNHNSLSYDELWIAFEDTDPRPDNSNLVYDMYSDNPNGSEPYTYTFGSDQCGNYSGEGSCYNREHSWPKSWFNEGSPMYTDLVHLVPTDGYVNRMRGNLAYGEVTQTDWTSENGSKRGYTNAGWTSSMVFEPIDEYKGDFARIYFYMSVRYYNEDNSWEENDMVDGSQIKPEALEMLMEWHENDPVSIKEQYRNEAIYDWQHNRNPFVDNPEFVEYIWGDPNTLKESLTIISINPNPVSSFLSIKYNTNDNYTYELFDFLGETIIKSTIEEKSFTIDFSSYDSGIYILRMTNNKTQQVTIHKIIKG
jgi:endonuclease I